MPQITIFCKSLIEKHLFDDSKNVCFNLGVDAGSPTQTTYVPQPSPRDFCTSLFLIEQVPTHRRRGLHQILRRLKYKL